MTVMNSQKKLSKALYIGASLIFLFYLIGNEFFWRYDSKLDIIINMKIRDAQMNQKTFVIHEQSVSPVDTSRREFKDIHRGKTSIAVFLDGSFDTIHLTLSAKYISEARSVHISSDSSSQIILIPNTIQGLPNGSNTILYLRNDSLRLLEFSGFIADIDKDGNEEVNIPDRGGWVRLDALTGDWIPAQLKPRRATP